MTRLGTEHTKEEIAALTDKIVEHRLNHLPWKYSCEVLGVSQSTYYRYLRKEASKQITEELAKNREAVFLEYYASQRDTLLRLRNKALKMEAAGNDPEARKWFALYAENYHAFIDRLVRAGYTPVPPGNYRESQAEPGLLEAELERAFREVNELADRRKAVIRNPDSDRTG